MRTTVLPPSTLQLATPALNALSVVRGAPFEKLYPQGTRACILVPNEEPMVREGSMQERALMDVHEHFPRQGVCELDMSKVFLGRLRQAILAQNFFFEREGATRFDEDSIIARRAQVVEKMVERDPSLRPHVERLLGKQREGASQASELSLLHFLQQIQGPSGKLYILDEHHRPDLQEHFATAVQSLYFISVIYLITSAVASLFLPENPTLKTINIIVATVSVLIGGLAAYGNFKASGVQDMARRRALDPILGGALYGRAKTVAQCIDQILAGETEDERPLLCFIDPVRYEHVRNYLIQQHGFVQTASPKLGV